MKMITLVVFVSVRVLFVNLLLSNSSRRSYADLRPIKYALDCIATGREEYIESKADERVACHAIRKVYLYFYDKVQSVF